MRVLLVKLADRLHNMRTLHFVPESKRRRIAEETLDIYAPLAGRMGMQSLRDELENLSFRTLTPEADAMIEARLTDLRASNGAVIARIENELAAELSARGIKADVKGREKSPYSIWRKMERKSVSFEQLSDIYGFRVIVEIRRRLLSRSSASCTRNGPSFRAVSRITSRRPSRTIIARIHTTVIGPGRQRVELQVRTREMDDIAENGIAAHTLYKDGRVSDTDALERESRAYGWLRRTIELLGEGDTPEEFLEHTKLELFHDQVFCFTPKGRLIALPRGATPIDFAYAVHTDIGNKAVGARINGRIAPLLSELQNGDEVSIVTAEGQTPPAAWETLVVTGKARAAIRRATREAVRSQYAELGRQIVKRAFERAGKTFSPEKLKAALPRLARSNAEDVLAAVGRGEMFSGDVVKAVHPEFEPERLSGGGPSKGESGWFGLRKADSLVFKVPGSDQPASLRLDSHSWPWRRSAGALRAHRRRGAGRPHRGHPHARRGDHDLPDPVARAHPVRRPARALARRALGHRGGAHGPLSRRRSWSRPSTSRARWASSPG